MSDSPDLDPESVGPEPCLSACRLCHRQFKPRKPNQAYCGALCRRKSLRLRQRADELAEHHGGSRVSASRLWHSHQAQRLRQGLPTLRRHEQATAYAAVLEAQAQLEYWGQQLVLRRRRYAAVEAGPLQLLCKRALAPGQAIPIERDATHGAIVATGGQAAYVVLAIATTSTTNPVPHLDSEPL